MENFNRMTIRENGNTFDVFKMKRQQDGGWSTDMAQKRFVYFVSGAAKPMFSGSYTECADFIESQGALFMTEHRVAV